MWSKTSWVVRQAPRGRDMMTDPSGLGEVSNVIKGFRGMDRQNLRGVLEMS